MLQVHVGPRVGPARHWFFGKSKWYGGGKSMAIAVLLERTSKSKGIYGRSAVISIENVICESRL